MKPDATNGLTVLSFGAGQDSTSILYKLLREPDYYARWVKGRLIVLMSDTGNEHPHTYQHVTYIRQLCQENGLPFYFITPDLGFHPRTWPTLTAQFKRNNTIMSMMFPRSCTDNLKIKPMYNFLDDYIARQWYGYTEEERPKRKKFIKRFVADHGKITVLIGIASGEEKRIFAAGRNDAKKKQLDLFRNKLPSQNWMDYCLDKKYPLAVEGIDRAGCQNYIRSTGWNLPYPSNCLMCPFLSKIELLWLYRTMPETFEDWVSMERAKIDKSVTAGKRNLGVKGDQLLPEILKQAIEEYGHMTEEQLNEYKMSHGHCVLSTY